MRSTLAWFGFDKPAPAAEYSVIAKCPVCGRQHITVFRLRHISDSLWVRIGQSFRYAAHFDFRRMRRCANSGRNPKW